MGAVIWMVVGGAAAVKGMCGTVDRVIAFVACACERDTSVVGICGRAVGLVGNSVLLRVPEKCCINIIWCWWTDRSNHLKIITWYTLPFRYRRSLPESCPHYMDSTSATFHETRKWLWMYWVNGLVWKSPHLSPTPSTSMWLEEKKCNGQSLWMAHWRGKSWSNLQWFSCVSQRLFVLACSVLPIQWWWRKWCRKDSCHLRWYVWMLKVLSSRLQVHQVFDSM